MPSFVHRVVRATLAIGLAVGLTASLAASALAAEDGVARGETMWGMTLTNLDGMTLYTSDMDETGVSSCYDACMDTWHPLVLNQPRVGANTVPGFGVTLRADGTIQGTFMGHPLYTFAGDSQPGQVNGEGALDHWSVTGDSLTEEGRAGRD